jgi:phosphatidyl-myo-inositol dimannoside synthase
MLPPMRPGADKPRLLLLTPDFPPARGGIQVLAQRLASGMSGFHTRVVTLDSPGARAFDAAGHLATRRVPVGGMPGMARAVALNGTALVEAVRHRPHVVLSAHLLTSPAAALLRRTVGTPTVQYFYAKEIPDKPGLARFAARQADRSVAISSYAANLLAAQGARPASVTLVSPGVDLPSGLAAEPASHSSPRRPTFLTVARLRDRYKGHDVLIDALPAVRAKVPDVEWIVIGDGPLRSELEGRAHARGVADAVRFLGAVGDDERDRWLRRADLLAMPSRLPGPGRAGEGFGIVYLEAGAHGKPVVAGNVAGAVDAVVHEETGLLVDPADPPAVAAAIAALLLDDQMARRMGAAGARRARAFAWPLIVARVEAVVHEVLAGASPRQRVSRSRVGV